MRASNNGRVAQTLVHRHTQPASLSCDQSSNFYMYIFFLNSGESWCTHSTLLPSPLPFFPLFPSFGIFILIWACPKRNEIWTLHAALIPRLMQSWAWLRTCATLFHDEVSFPISPPRASSIFHAAQISPASKSLDRLFGFISCSGLFDYYKMWLCIKFI